MFFGGLFFCSFFFKISFSLQKEEDVWKKKNKQRKIWPSFDSKKAIFGPSFDSTAFFWGGGGAWDLGETRPKFAEKFAEEFAEKLVGKLPAIRQTKVTTSTWDAAFPGQNQGKSEKWLGEGARHLWGSLGFPEQMSSESVLHWCLLAWSPNTICTLSWPLFGLSLLLTRELQQQSKHQHTSTNNPPDSKNCKLVGPRLSGHVLWSTTRAEGLWCLFRPLRATGLQEGVAGQQFSVNRFWFVLSSGGLPPLGLYTALGVPNLSKRFSGDPPRDLASKVCSTSVDFLLWPVFRELLVGVNSPKIHRMLTPYITWAQTTHWFIV